MLPRGRPLAAAFLVLAVACGTHGSPPERAVDIAVGPAAAEPFLFRPDTIAPAIDPPGTELAVARGAAFRVYGAPRASSAVRRLGAANDWGQPLALPILDARTDPAGTGWLRVRVPERPNGRTGWILADAARTRRVHDRIQVDLSDHLLQRWESGRVTARFRVAVGAPSTPTTPGRFFVWAQVPYDDASGAYGVFALGLSGFSEVLTGWPGGGRMAIHGTIDPSHLGRDVSHGCVRVYNAQMLRLRDVPMGTPVLIRP
jgi:lipoprotein-anchoring transpeptidase ErfK/SrfK